jgi:hypothetical protein
VSPSLYNFEPRSYSLILSGFVQLKDASVTNQLCNFPYPLKSHAEDPQREEG